MVGLDDRLHELRDLADRTTSVGVREGEGLENVDGAVEDLQPYRDSCRREPLGHQLRVGPQRLFGSHLQQERTQAMQVGVDRRRDRAAGSIAQQEDLAA